MRTALLLALAGGLLQAGPATIDNVAGTGEAGFTGDGGPAAKATLNQPFHCDLAAGHLYVAEAFNHCVRRVDLRTGTITTVAGTGRKGYTGDGGPATKATFNEPYAAVADADNSLYVVDRLNAVVRKVDGRSSTVTTVAGTGEKGYGGDGGPGARAMLREPNDCCLDGKGGLLIADVSDWRVRRLDLKTGTITTVAGTGPFRGRLTREALGDGGPATRAVVFEARAVCVDAAGNTFICERRGNRIRRIDAKGVITTVAGTGAKGDRDGPGTEATFNGPKGVRCDRTGNVYVVDTENHSIRKVEAGTWRVTTLAGGRKGSGGDGGDALKAGLDRPHGCIIDKDGVIYIADSSNHRVRRVRP